MSERVILDRKTLSVPKRTFDKLLPVLMESRKSDYRQKLGNRIAIGTLLAELLDLSEEDMEVVAEWYTVVELKAFILGKLNAEKQ